MAEPIKLPDMGKQVGPLPLGAWIIIFAAAFTIAIYARRQAGDEADVIADDFAEEDISSPAGVGEGPGWTYVGPPQNVPPTEEFEPISNAEWANYAAARMISETQYPPGLVIGSITRYLGRKPLDSRQYALIEAAIRRVGPPPYPLPLIRSGPGQGRDRVDPPDRPPKPPPAVRRGDWHWIRSRSVTLQQIAVRYYGSGGENRWRDIFEANKRGVNRPGPTPGWMTNPNDIRVGKWLYIPGPTPRDPQAGQGRTPRQEKARDRRVGVIRRRRRERRQDQPWFDPREEMQS